MRTLSVLLLTGLAATVACDRKKPDTPAPAQTQAQPQTNPPLLQGIPTHKAALTLAVYRETPSGAQVKVGPNFLFRSGDKVRFSVQANQTSPTSSPSNFVAVNPLTWS